MHLPGGELKLRVGTVERGGEIRKSLEPAKPGTSSAPQALPISSAPPLPPAAAPPTPLAKRGMVRRRMASGKVRCTRKLRSWIVEQVESGKFPGVCWDDAAKTMFRIPWKHAGKQDFREDQDAAIFKAWALFKEKHKDGDIGHPAVWKTRLRCALNKSSEFEEVPERGRMDVAEPYKVYRILPAGTLPNQPRNQKSPCKRSISCVSPEREENMENGRTNGVVNHSDSGSNIGGGGNGSNRSDSNSNCNSELEEGAGTTEATIREDPVFLEHQLPLNSDYSLLLTFIYGGRVVGKTQVHSLDCRLVAERSDSESSMEQVEFPKPDPLEPTQRLLSQLERGVLVASNSRGLFVQRLCPIPISWNAPEAPPGPGPHLLPSNKCVELFKTTYFCRDLAQYFQGQGPPPKFQATLHFWEESPGSSHSQENLITVQMEQAFARHLLEKIPEEEKAALFLLQHTEQSPSALGH